MIAINCKRAYEKSSTDDGARILIDAMWPRGIKKQDLPLDDWYKDISPSKELRQWFGHKPERWGEFRRRYLHELSAYKTRLKALLAEAKNGRLTLIYSAKDEQHNNARVVCEYLQKLPSS